ncbi:imidazoleglycerol-phosphate dehydratase HisB [Hansschlegelia zhihuaiae]|uniref:Imidazoleglycerol-phosphate dehydratase n=1 Tax=Hansschlegelia zhihuaiae TaxID=405005 RepID=A0A4Q0MAU1_9HYPH|nr:imidazoleglycerol-phosphate dehydratase HisB [Hansschlegelia zhihuaiae]RXF70324.1 imidazoleglycerol-phosphate dehydratase HisB [Hansschlegelia zhihuaiae]
MRRAEVTRKTSETEIALSVDLDGAGASEISTGVGFLDHMLELLSRHAMIDLKVEAKGDVHVDFHHVTEDVGIALGQAVRKALGDMKGLTRYADCLMPMDETLTRVAIDVSGRPFLVWRTAFPAPKIGQFDSELVREFFQGFSTHAAVTLHVETLYGANAHHIAESCFKGLARCLKAALAVDPRAGDRLPSTKGRIGD